MSTNSVSPQTFLGGTWSRIQDRFLLCAGSTYVAGNTGGSATHTLTIDEMPSHNHTLAMANAGVNRIEEAGYSSGEVKQTSNIPIQNRGGSQPHNNMPPYLVVYCWTRTA